MSGGFSSGEIELIEYAFNDILKFGVEKIKNKPDNPDRYSPFDNTRTCFSQPCQKVFKNRRRKSKIY